MLNELAGLDGFLDYFLPIGCLIIGWCDFLINKKNSSEIEKFVNFSVAVFFSFMFKEDRAFIPGIISPYP